MKKVLIISTSYDEQKMLEEVIRHQGVVEFQVETTASFGQDASWWVINPPDVLVIQLPEDSLIQEYYFSKLRKDVPKTQPVVFINKSISGSLMQVSTEFARVRMLKSPLEPFFLYRAVSELIRDYNENEQQSHPRYLTEQEVELSSDYSHDKTKATMRNLSLGGAYLEMGLGGLPLNPGDLAKISVILGKPPKQYVFDVKVVWSKVLEDQKNRGVGMTFVDRQEVYDSLLKNL